MSEVKLLPCPMCGGPAEYARVETEYWVHCSWETCGTSGPFRSSAKFAGVAWNCRADAVSDGKGVEK